MSNAMMTLKEFHDTHTKLGSNDVIIDVRNPDEFEETRIQGAKNFPVNDIAQHIDELKKYDRVFIHCKRGGRAKTAFEALKNAGLANLYCVYDAGMDAWIESGYPVIRGG